ncbi:hypothetical protein HDU99_010378, partial [Rhizoclosmatium hyalinum]
MLSNKAKLSNVFKKVATLQEENKELFFEFHPYFVVTLSAKKSIGVNVTNDNDVVVELKNDDIMAELMKMISTHFGGIKNVLVYYLDNGAKRSITDSESLQRGLRQTSDICFEAENSTPEQTETLVSDDIPSRIFEQDATSHKESDLFISYNWSTKSQVNTVIDRLKGLKPELDVWQDSKNMTSDIYDAMGTGISGCKAVVACFSVGYLKSINCIKELKFAQVLNKPIIPVFFFEDSEDIVSLMKQYCGAFFIIAGNLYSDFKRWDISDTRWETAFNTFIKEVESALHNVSYTVVASNSPLDAWLQPESFTADLEVYSKEYVPGTRKWIVADLEAWALTEERVMYLNGGAGTGKSLIVYSLTKNLPPTFIIGALFICRYNNARKSDPIVLVCTIVSSLCCQLGGIFQQHVKSEMKKDIDRVNERKQSLLKTPVEAFKTLVVEGLKHMPESNWKDKTLLIVIDALDELNKDSRHSMLTILTAICPTLPDFVKIVTTGRPEQDIYFALQKLSPFVLSPADSNNKADLELFGKYQFKELWGEIEEGTEADLCCKALVEHSEGLFIYARNVCELIKQANLQSKEALTLIKAMTSGSDDVYKAIIERELQYNRAERLVQFKQVFAVIFTAKKPLTLNNLANIGGLDMNDVKIVVAEFRSILKIEAGGMVSAIHKSVKDYFTDYTRCGPELYIQVVDANLAVRCLQILITNLSRNMAHLDPAKIYSKDELAQLSAFNEDVQYALQFWASHFTLGFDSTSAENQKEIIKILYQFCIKSLPFYLEALLLASKLNDVFPMVESVSDILSRFSHMNVKTVLSLLNDVKFVGINFRNQLLASPLQVYNHALIAVPQETKYYRFYQDLASACITIGAEKEWGPFQFAGHSDMVNSVAFSADSKTVVSGSWDNTVKLWSVKTGECIKTFVGHSWWVESVAFSADSKTVVSGSQDGNIKFWHVETGECVKSLAGHYSSVNSVAFSADSKTVVSGSKDGNVKFWHVETGRCVKTLSGHSKSVTSVAFSPDSKTVVSGSWDNTVKLWSVETGKCVKTFVGHSGWVESVAFSADSKTVVSGSRDENVNLWHVKTGQCVKTFVGHTHIVTSAAFSPDSKRVVSGSSDKTVKLWLIATGQCVKTFFGHSGIIYSVVFSPDAKSVISGCWGNTIELWYLETEELCTNLEGHSQIVNSVAFSNDFKTVVSGSWDKTVKLWSVETGRCVKTLSGHSDNVTS